LVQVNSLVQDSGAAALLDQLCGDGPPGTSECLGDVVTRLVHLRDQLIAARRANTPRGEELRRINAILSLVFGIEYPMGGRQWTRLCEARDALKDMLRRQQLTG
jgi:hypothetical protein